MDVILLLLGFHLLLCFSFYALNKNESRRARWFSILCGVAGIVLVLSGLSTFLPPLAALMFGVVLLDVVGLLVGKKPTTVQYRQPAQRRRRMYKATQSSATPQINPATGLPMQGGIGDIDVAGNPYGTDQTFHHHNHHGPHSW